MIADTSALVAILRDEPEGERFMELLLSAGRVRVAAGTLLEARIVAERDVAADRVDRLLEQLGAEVAPMDVQQVGLAFEGFRRFGKGRHPAGLNLGDLFAYALAKALDEPLLFKGADFARTDVKNAAE